MPYRCTAGSDARGTCELNEYIARYRSTEAGLALDEDTRRSGEAAANRDHDKLVAATRRLAVEQDENARLKKALEEAQKKLDAVSQLERAAKERGNAPGGTQ